MSKASSFGKQGLPICAHTVPSKTCHLLGVILPMLCFTQINISEFGPTFFSLPRASYPTTRCYVDDKYIASTDGSASQVWLAE